MGMQQQQLDNAWLAALRTPIRLAGGAPAFDSYLMVDWSAASEKVTREDSIWWCLAGWSGGELGVRGLSNPPTRSAAMEEILAVLLEERDQRRSVLLGFDFPFGYPMGLAVSLGLAGTPWRATWDEWSRLIHDDEHNRNNRFEVAADLNRRIHGGAGPFWGCPERFASPHLTMGKDFQYPIKGGLYERRFTEELVRSAQPVWKLWTTGSVGSQSLLGIPRLRRLLQEPRLAPVLKVWPFETGFSLPERPSAEGRILLAEIYPSLVRVPDIEGQVKDALQVEAMARHFARHDANGTIREFFEPPPRVLPEALAACVAEEGWILGVG